ncbi:MAG: Sapep family Mn(2+)-dependent dipeptidase [Clostridia bacterium]|nr:Sapep family Mn(2+)-dependent dipeptidase [Clostridia bacterium]
MENAIFEKLKASLREFLQIPSVRGEAEEGAPCGVGVAKALDYVTKLALSLGFESSKNVDGYIGYVDLGEGEDCFGILSHVDVVPPGEGWTRDPWGGEEIDGKIYGRGALDDKGPTLSVLYAIHALLKDGYKPKKRIRVLFGCDEETGGKPKYCAWESIERYIESGEKLPDVGISPDADFPVINAEKGIANLRLTCDAPNYLISALGGTALNIVPNRSEFKIVNNGANFENVEGVEVEKRKEYILLSGFGKNAHAAHADKGDNAIVKVISYLSRCYGGVMCEIENKLKDVFASGLNCAISDDESGKLTQNVGKIELVDGKLNIYLNIRYPVTYSIETVVTRISEAWSLGEVELLRDQKPLYLPKDHYLVQTLLESYNSVTGENAEPIAIGGGTYARSLPCGVAFGALFPNQEDTMHSPDEHVDVDYLYKSCEIYYDALKKLCF